MLPILNTRADLDALKGSPDYGQALQAILGSAMTWVNQAPAGEPADWQLIPVMNTIEAMRFATHDELLAECAAAGVAVPPPSQMPTLPPVAPPPVPTSVHMWQAKAVLLQEGILAAADAAIASANNPILTLAWTSAADISRNAAAVAAIGAALGLTSSQIDQLFRQAAAIQV